MVLSSSSTAAAAATTTRPQVAVERRSRPQKEQALNCPRCNSTNTKFCYYNNYSLTQPRYFCKACRRYWTEGGSLRNVPVGGGSRKNKRSSSSIATPSTTATATSSSQNPKFPNHSLPDFSDFPRIESNSSCTTTTSAMDLLRAGISGRGLGPFMQMPMPTPAPQYRPGFGLQELRNPSLDFPLDGTGGYGGLQMQGVQEISTNGRLLFPFEDLKVSPSIAEFEQNRGQGGGDPPGFWNGMIGGGGSW